MDKPFKIWFGGGMTIVYAASVNAAKRWAAEEFGRANGPYRATPAAQSDIDWCKGMGGMIHSEPEAASS